MATDAGFRFATMMIGRAVEQIRANQGAVRIEEIWKNRKMKNQFASSVLSDNYLYGFDNSILKCIEADTGERNSGKPVDLERGR